MAISDTLNARGNRYGEFTTHAKYTQDLKRVLQRSPNWDMMGDDQREALEMVMHKVGRILNGDPNYSDSWHDIAGYATLVDTRLSRVDSSANPPPAPGNAGPVMATSMFPPAPVPATDSFRPLQPIVSAPVAPPVVAAPPAPLVMKPKVDEETAGE